MAEDTGKQVRKTWRIFEGYVHRREVYAGEGKSEVLEQPKLALTQYVDTDRSSKRYQKRVYRYASKIHREGRVLDIGCGTAYKTLKYFRKAETLGLEIEPTLSMLRERFPERCWEESDFTKIPKGRFSMVVCADVIEHIVDPDDLLDFVDRVDFETCVMSTPDRDTLNNPLGPPRNPSHLREWSFAEFRDYISGRFQVIEHRHCREPGYKSQLVAFRKQGRGI